MKKKRIYVAGHRGLVGNAIVVELQRRGYGDLVLRSRDELDLTNYSAVEQFFEEIRPAVVCLAAAKVGGIQANWKYPAEFIYDNLAIQTNVIHSAWRFGVERFIFLGSSCIYPKAAPQPIREEFLLSGALEPTNEPYAIAKIAGLKMCQAYYRQYGFQSINLMPTNLYGPNDNFDLQTSHVLPALIRKFHDAKVERRSTVEIWGTGRPRREFLHVADLAKAVGDLLELPFDAILKVAPDLVLNVGTGEDIEIRHLAEIICQIIHHEVELRFDPSQPDGTSSKRLDVTRMHSFGWTPQISLEDGIRETYEWFSKSSEPNLQLT